MTSGSSARPAANRNGRAAFLVTAILVALVAAVVAIVIVTRPPAGPAASAEPVAGLIAFDTQILGEPGDSGVEFVVFGDFQCGGCAAAAPHIDGFRNEFAGQVTFAFRHFPLERHAHAVEAALAAEAAGRQGKFTEMHDLLYAQQAEWSDTGDPGRLFRHYATQLGLDGERFQADLDSAEALARVTADRELAEELGLRGAPTMFLDGVQLNPKTYDDIRNALLEALER